MCKKTYYPSSPIPPTCFAVMAFLHSCIGATEVLNDLLKDWFSYVGPIVIRLQTERMFLFGPLPLPWGSFTHVHAYMTNWLMLDQ